MKKFWWLDKIDHLSPKVQSAKRQEATKYNPKSLIWIKYFLLGVKLAQRV